ncbi:hypothetical protein FA13DRAFT_1913232 [Coprinellus micaceus]|uniref:Uncharacterized protein n=1 Tax=Coprinellus micaceus TaxID=71717 RepID=A0A4Y7SQ54_COPMI|nr:hypothetical protein FA13DRAFT_1913232 [Coprinellus micaceus]
MKTPTNHGISPLDWLPFLPSLHFQGSDTPASSSLPPGLGFKNVKNEERIRVGECNFGDHDEGLGVNGWMEARGSDASNHSSPSPPPQPPPTLTPPSSTTWTAAGLDSYLQYPQSLAFTGLGLFRKRFVPSLPPSEGVSISPIRSLAEAARFNPIAAASGPILRHSRRETIRRQRIEPEQRSDKLQDGYAHLKETLPPSNQKSKSSKVSLHYLPSHRPHPLSRDQTVKEQLEFRRVPQTPQHQRGPHAGCRLTASPAQVSVASPPAKLSGPSLSPTLKNLFRRHLPARQDHLRHTALTYYGQDRTRTHCICIFTHLILPVPGLSLNTTTQLWRSQRPHGQWTPDFLVLAALTPQDAVPVPSNSARPSSGSRSTLRHKGRASKSNGDIAGTKTRSSSLRRQFFLSSQCINIKSEQRGDKIAMPSQHVSPTVQPETQQVAPQVSAAPSQRRLLFLFNLFKALVLLSPTLHDLSIIQTAPTYQTGLSPTTALTYYRHDTRHTHASHRIPPIPLASTEPRLSSSLPSHPNNLPPNPPQPRCTSSNLSAGPAHLDPLHDPVPTSSTPGRREEALTVVWAKPNAIPEKPTHWSNDHQRARYLYSLSGATPYEMGPVKFRHAEGGWGTFDLDAWVLEECADSEEFRLLNLYTELSSQEAKATGLCQGDKVDKIAGNKRWKGVMKGEGKERSSLAPPHLFNLKVPKGREALAAALHWDLEDPLAWLVEVSNSYSGFQFLFGLHTSPQWLTKDMWTQSVLPTTGKQRGYKVALALEFRTKVLAFLSHDLLFSVKWVDRVQAPGLTLTQAHPDLTGVDIYADFGGFLDALVLWIEYRRARARRTGYVVDVIRTQGPNVWVGVGIYTASEILYIAGISPFLSEQEVFDSASRCARLVNAFWQFAHDAQDLYVRCMVEDVLAPNKDQRGLYSQYLNVFKKQMINVTARMAKTIDAYESRLDELGEKKFWLRASRDKRDQQPKDAFEPSHMANALLLRTCQHKFSDQSRDTTSSRHECANCKRSPCDKANKVFSFGRLIYGSEQWVKQAPPELLEFEERQGSDILTAGYDKARRNGKITYIDRYTTYLPEFEPQTIIAPDFKAKGCPKRPTYHHRINDTVNVYSVIPNYPRNSYANEKQREAAKEAIRKEGGWKLPRVTLVAEDKSKKASFNETRQTDGLVAIGPLEYCGNGKPIKHGGQVRVSLVKDGDPRFISTSTSSTFLLERSARCQVATKVDRTVDQARARKAIQALKIAATHAQGKVSKAQSISITKQRVKARNLVKKEINAKVAEMVHLKKALEVASKTMRPPQPTTPSTMVPAMHSPAEPDTEAEEPRQRSLGAAKT